MITHDRLLRLTNYDPYTGEFRFTLAPRNRPDLFGKVIGSISKKDGRRRIKLDQGCYLASRLAWFYVTGSWPEAEIDHKNTIQSDDRFLNLREATSSQNKCNRKRHTLKSKYKGVSPCGSRWRVQICRFYENKTVGIFDTEEEAARAYDAKAVELMGEFARLNFPESING